MINMIGGTCSVPGSHLFADDPGGGRTDADIEAWAVSPQKALPSARVE